MNLAWKIAWRYLFSKKSHGAVNVISIVSVAGVAVATAAIVIVLSVFNGFTALAEMHLSAIDPDVTVRAAKGKAIEDVASATDRIVGVDGVKAVEAIVEERALAMAGTKQMPVIFKGVDTAYHRVSGLDSLMIDGVRLAYPFGMPGLQASVGVAINAEVRPGSSTTVNLYVPRRQGRINPGNPQASLRQKEFMLTGVFRVDQPEYDNEYVFIPLAEARDLLGYTPNQATALEVAIADGAQPEKVAERISKALGAGYDVRTRRQNEEVSFRMIEIEKWVTFLMLAFILVIASFNIVSTLSLLVIEKRDNMATLRALGARRGLVRGVFMRQGWLISMAGGVAGILLGAVLSLAQQYGGFIKLSGDPSQLTIDRYPVRLAWPDILIVLAAVAVVALAASQATRLFVRRENKITYNL